MVGGLTGGPIPTKTPSSMDRIAATACDDCVIARVLEPSRSCSWRSKGLVGKPAAASLSIHLQHGFVGGVGRCP